MNTLNSHPAVIFGAWLKEHRKPVPSRVFAGRIQLSPAEYAEVEAGIVEWIQDLQELLIPEALSFDDDKRAEFNYLLRQAREASPLRFDQLFSQEDLAPVRCCTSDGSQITPETRAAILKAVFTPLSKERR